MTKEKRLSADTNAAIFPSIPTEGESSMNIVGSPEVLEAIAEACRMSAAGDDTVVVVGDLVLKVRRCDGE